MDIEELTCDLVKNMQKLCTTRFKNGELPMSPPEIKVNNQWILTKSYSKFAEKIRKMEVRENDIWVLSYPKSGTTWTQEMVWLLGNDINFKAAKETELYMRFPFLDYTALLPDEQVKDDEESTIDIVINWPRTERRFIKSHLPVELLPETLFEVNPKIIYIHRNPKSTAISYYHHFTTWNNYEGNLEDFLDLFLKDQIIFSPYWKHVLDFWELRHKKDNLLILSYEEMNTDLPVQLKKTADFLGVTYTKEQETALLSHLKFNNMKDNKMVNFQPALEEVQKTLPFIREGKTKGWQKVMSPEMIERFDTWTEGKLRGCNFPREHAY